jgi:hypothetical protein
MPFRRMFTTLGSARFVGEAQRTCHLLEESDPVYATALFSVATAL